MREGAGGIAGWLAARLPARVRERCFLPAYYELIATRADLGTAQGAWRRRLGALAFRAHVAVALVQCALIAISDREGPAGSPRDRHRGLDPMLLQDLRFAARLLRKRPGFTAVATATLALGIGANAAIFSIVHAVLLRPLPYRDPDRILELNETARGGLTTLSPPNLRDWEAQNSTFSGIAAYDDVAVTLTGAGEPSQLDAALVAAELFEVLGVPPLYGRGFSIDEERPGGPRAVVLGHGLWRRLFGADPSILGRTLTFDGKPYTVVGIMPERFTFPGEIDLWFPLRTTDDELRPNQRGAHYLNAVGRLKPGVTVEQAVDDLARIEERIAAQHESVQDYGVWAQPLLDSMTAGVRKPLLMLLGAVGFVLLIACTNVSNLLLARATTRRTEIAIRSALGAGRWRIVRQLLAESVLLALVGGVCGLLLASWGVRLLDGWLPQDLPRSSGIGVNATVLIFCTAVSVATGIAFGVVPSLDASTSLTAQLGEARRDGSSGSGRRRFRSVLVAVEVAVALVLLAGAGLALRSFDRLSRIDPGFDATGVLSARLSVPDGRYPDSGAVARFYRQLVEALQQQPGVSAAGAVMIPPLGRGGFGGTFTVIGAADVDDQRMQVRAATAGYLEALRIPLRRGRLFDPTDREGSQPVAIVSESAARRFWPGQDPVGRRIRLHVAVAGRESEREIVGVVGDVKLRTIDSAYTPTVYVPHAQYAAESMTVFVRTTGDPLALVPMVRSQLAAIDPEMALTGVRPAGDLVSAALAQSRFRMTVLGLFALIALVLAAVGLYGVMAFAVGQRQGEIGVRMALGADRAAVLALVLRQGLTPVAIGLAAGLAAAAALTRILRGMLYDVDAFDPITYAAVAAILALVSTIACYIPARRATRVDPLSALRAN